MILTDYFRSSHDLAWDYAKQCGVEHGVIRLPEDSDFDITDFSHWKKVYKEYIDFHTQRSRLQIKNLLLIRDSIRMGYDKFEILGDTSFSYQVSDYFIDQ